MEFRIVFFLCFTILVSSFATAQEETDKWKLQLALGVNNPIDDGKNDGYFTKYLNFPSVNLGIQYMFTRQFGAKLDYGFNRSSNDTGSKEFKLNFSRVNFQFVYDVTNDLRFLPESITIVANIGPGMSFTQPLGNDSENTYTYLNLLAGLEIHYKVSRTFSVFTDVSYAYSLASKDKYDANIDGFSFNGDLIYASIGISVSLSGCYYCN
jgi:Outer membrane protein beta-barrel domain